MRLVITGIVIAWAQAGSTRTIASAGTAIVGTVDSAFGVTAICSCFFEPCCSALETGLLGRRLAGTRPPLPEAGIDRFVWSGRALQEVSSMRRIQSCINVSGLWLECVVLRAIMDIGARAI